MVDKILKFIKQNRWYILPPVLFFLVVLFAPLPTPLFDTQYTTVLQSSNQQLLGAKIAADGQWRFPPSDSVPVKFKTALLLFEDEHFYSHPGINPFSIWRATKQNLKAGKVVSGGSTISMQVIRMARGNRSRTFLQKTIEIILTLKLELFYSKKEILNLYASHAPFGGNVVGLSAASWRYFKRPPTQLSWAEAASLAILPNQPSVIFPGKNEQKYLNKRNKLLDKMYHHHLFDSMSLQLYKAEELPSKPAKMPELAAHLLEKAINDGKQGTFIQSSILKDLQIKVKNKTDRYSKRISNSEIYNAASIVIEVKTGKVVSYVGNTNSAPGNHSQYVDIIQAKRSPGSLLKPFLYALALDEGVIMPRELLRDIPLFYKGFSPQNFDKKFRGAVPANEALAKSLNIPFVFLLKEYGFQKFHQKLKNIGMNTLNFPPGHYGLSLILGGSEATLWDLTAMYAGLTRTAYKAENEQYYAEDFRPNSYLKTTKNHSSSPETTKGMKTGEIRIHPAWETLEALKALNRPEGYNEWENFQSARDISWKTGTSYGFKDAWAIGTNGEYVIGVWIGNADGEGRPELTGVSAAAPLLFDLFNEVTGEVSAERPNAPARIVCKKSGLVATKNCETTYEYELPDHMISGKICQYHHKIFLDKKAAYQVNSSCYQISEMATRNWFVLPAVQAWYYKLYHPLYKNPPKFLPDCNINTTNDFMEFIYPSQFTKIYIPKELDGTPGKAVFEVAHRKPSTTIFWHLDNEYMGQTNQLHQLGFHPPQGKHLISLVDQDGNRMEQQIEVISE